MKKIGVVFAIIIIIVLIVLSGNLIEWNKAGEFRIKQSITGKMTYRPDPGPFWQGFGSIYRYKKVATIGFGTEKGEGSADIEAIPVIFNDGSRAFITAFIIGQVALSSSRKPE